MALSSDTGDSSGFMCHVSVKIIDQESAKHTTALLNSIKDGTPRLHVKKL